LSNKIKASDGVNINIEDIGAGRPIIFIHGWPVNHRMFEYQFTELPKHGYRCIGIDLGGFGDSDKPWNNYNYDTMADDLQAVVEKLNLQNAVLVGFSMGGAIAIHYIARHKGLGISKLVLLGILYDSGY
jgi:non-heme chloroperoxidase